MAAAVRQLLHSGLKKTEVPMAPPFVSCLACGGGSLRPAMNEPFALVTGTTGFIAAWLVPTLIADGWRVRGTGRRPRPDGLPVEAEYQPADLVADDLADLCAGVTHVFHL